MKIKIDRNLKRTSVKKLISSRSDSQHLQLRIDRNNYAYLSEDVGNNNLDDVIYRFDTWCRGNGYVGPNAAANKEWVDEIYQRLKKVRPSKISTHQLD